MRWLLLGAAALLLAGCGGGVSAQGPGSDGSPVLPDAPAPPIAAADGPAPDWLARLLHPQAESAAGVDSQGTFQFCFGVDAADSNGHTSSTSDCSGKPTAEQLGQLEAQRKAWLEAVAPEAGAPPRVVATLPLAGGGTASFAAWTAVGGDPCWTTEIEVGGGGGGGGPDGPCAHAASPDSRLALPPCDALCLSSSGGGSSEENEVYVLAGTVPADADALRVMLAGGAVTTYPLSGPLFPGFPQRRIFLLELGDRDWRTLELVRDGAVVRSVEMPKFQAASEDCRAQLGPPPKPVDMPAGQADLQKLFGPYEATMNACLRAAGALSQLSGTVPSSQPLPTTTP
jgi:hypothetical protein